MPTKEWLIEHWFTVLSLVVYVLANVLPRPSGDRMVGATGIFWRLLDRLCFLTSHGLPGSLKSPLARSVVAAAVERKPDEAQAGLSEPDATKAEEASKPRRKGKGS